MNHFKDIPANKICADCQLKHDLAFALRLQQLLADVSSRFVTRTEAPVDDTIGEIQQLICETLGLDRSSLWQATKGSPRLALTHSWQRSGSIPLGRKRATTENKISVVS